MELRTPKQIFEQDFEPFEDLTDKSLIQKKIENIQIETLLFAKDSIFESLPESKKEWNEGDYGKFFAAHDIWELSKKIKN